MVVGHSYIHWFHKFVERKEEKDVNLGLSAARVTYHGKRGGSVFDIIKTWKPLLENENLDVIVLVIGENDVKGLYGYVVSGKSDS